MKSSTNTLKVGKDGKETEVEDRTSITPQPRRLLKRRNIFGSPAGTLIMLVPNYVHCRQALQLSSSESVFPLGGACRNGAAMLLSKRACLSRRSVYRVDHWFEEP